MLDKILDTLHLKKKPLPLSTPTETLPPPTLTEVAANHPFLQQLYDLSQLAAARGTPTTFPDGYVQCSLVFPPQPGPPTQGWWVTVDNGLIDSSAPTPGVRTPASINLIENAPPSQEQGPQAVRSDLFNLTVNQRGQITQLTLNAALWLRQMPGVEFPLNATEIPGIHGQYNIIHQETNLDKVDPQVITFVSKIVGQARYDSLSVH